MKTLLERLKHDKAYLMLANTPTYPTLCEKSIQVLGTKYHWVDLTLLEAIDFLGVINESSTDSFLTLRLSECFIPHEAKIELDYSQIAHTEMEDIGCNPYILSATYFGRDMTEYELELLNNNSQFVYDEFITKIY
jgi:hypothetical protein